MTQKQKKEKPLYDTNGRWVEERGRIKGAIRRAFRLSPQMKEVLMAARVELPPKIKKDGNLGKKPIVRYKCAMCGGLFPQKHVNVDHINTVVPLWKCEADMTYDDIVRGIFCTVNNLQVLCCTPMIQNNGLPSCHKKKTDEERYLRDRWKIMSITEPCDWDLNKKGHRDFVEKCHAEWKLEYKCKTQEKLLRKKKKNTKNKKYGIIN